MNKSLLFVMAFVLQIGSATLVNPTGLLELSSEDTQLRTAENIYNVSDMERQAQRQEEQRRLTNYYRAQYFSRTQEEFLALLEYMNLNNN